jgi:hypothetical protein
MRMYGDFSRILGDGGQDHTRVLFQQGRPQTDADLNELSELVVRYLRHLAVDLMGPYGTAIDVVDTDGRVRPNDGFAIHLHNALDGLDGDLDEELRHELGHRVRLDLGEGFYYVQGIRCTLSQRNIDERCRNSHLDQEVGDFTSDPIVLASNIAHLRGPGRLRPPFFVYLRVWERELTALQDDALRDPALNANIVDTTIRSQAVWQVLASPFLPGTFDRPPNYSTPAELISEWLRCDTARTQRRSGRLGVARQRPAASRSDNLLYRVEVYRSGNLDTAAFVWSRDNGCVLYDVTEVDGQSWTLKAPFGASAETPATGQYLEFLDDAAPPPGQDRLIRRVITTTKTGQHSLVVTVEPAADLVLDPSLHPFVRLWNGVFLSRDAQVSPYHFQPNPPPSHGPGSGSQPANVHRIDDLEVWLEGEDEPNPYRAGDYWLIPTRTVSGRGPSVLWPQHEDRFVAVPARAAPDHLAPLAWVHTRHDAGHVWDLRSTFYRASIWEDLENPRRLARETRDDEDEDEDEDHR